MSILVYSCSFPIFPIHILQFRDVISHVITFSRLFFTDWERGYPRIESANLDGSDRRIFVDAYMGMPNALAMDFQNYQLCWTDAGLRKSTLSPEIKPKVGKSVLHFSEFANFTSRFGKIEND